MASKILLDRCSSAKDIKCGRHDRRGIRKSAGTRVRSGQSPHRRVKHEHPTVPQRLHIGLRRRVLPHLGVHRWRHDDGARGRQQGVGQEVVGQPVGGTGQQVGGGGNDEHQVSALAEAHMWHRMNSTPHCCRNRLTRECGPRRLTDELQC